MSFTDLYGVCRVINKLLRLLHCTLQYISGRYEQKLNTLKFLKCTLKLFFKKYIIIKLVVVFKKSWSARPCFRLKYAADSF